MSKGMLTAWLEALPKQKKVSVNGIIVFHMFFRLSCDIKGIFVVHEQRNYSNLVLWCIVSMVFTQ